LVLVTCLSSGVIVGIGDLFIFQHHSCYGLPVYLQVSLLVLVTCLSFSIILVMGYLFIFQHHSCYG